ncbi:hypothetical protein IKA92_07380 [bacterium]|nr:hypothetical protein [bacterium]MBR2387098.1 hypothetical protein [bacterium]
MKLFQSKIDKLSKKRQAIIARRDNAERAMRERNAKREAKSQALLNRGQEDWEETNRFMTKLNRELDKLAREINSEQIYVQEVASSETKDYLKDKAEKEAFKKIDKPFLEAEKEEKPKVTKK